VTPDDEEFDLFVKEVVREMTVKAGQKCTAIRRAIVPRQHLDAVARPLAARLAKVVVGDPAVEGVKMGALASHAQQPTWPSAWRCCGQGANGVRQRAFSPVGRAPRRRLLPAHAAAGAQPAGATATRCTTSRPSARSAR
jgi:oxepin-CoA hydrolase/3-oxo-5,6-dehydrosuberyl-CoA semialdehyde dehydrogenase